MAALDGMDREAIIAILQRHSGISARQVYEKAVWGALYTDGHVNIDSLMDEQQWYFARGEMARLLAPTDLVDDEFGRHANQVLGPATRPR